MDLDEIELKTTRRMNGADKTDYKKEAEKWERMYLDEVDKRVDIILLYNGLLKRIKDVEKCYNEMLTDVGGIKIINITGLSKKEKEEVINKRNCLLVQKQCYQEILERLAKKKGE